MRVPFSPPPSNPRFAMHESSLPGTHGAHESSGFNASRIAWFCGALALLIALAALVAVALIGGLRLPLPPTDALPAQQLGPVMVPQLQRTPAGDLQAYRRDKESLLTTYRWIDKSEGRLQIPIDRAMQLIAQRQTQSARSLTAPEHRP